MCFKIFNRVRYKFYSSLKICSALNKNEKLGAHQLSTKREENLEWKQNRLRPVPTTVDGLYFTKCMLFNQLSVVVERFKLSTMSKHSWCAEDFESRSGPQYWLLRVGKKILASQIAGAGCRVTLKFVTNL